MALDWRPLVDLVQRGQRILLTTHVRPDGDGLGSLKALATTFQAMGKQTTLVIPGFMPGRYAFLDPERAIKSFDSRVDHGPIDVLMVVDTGTWNQLAGLADYVRQSPAAKVVVDHHQTQDDLGAQRFVDVSAEATGRLAREIIAALGQPLLPDAANALFVALAMDTGWFRHGNVTPRTFTLAAELVAAGANPTAIYQQLYEQNSLGRSRLTGLVLERLTIGAGGRIAHSFVQKSDYGVTGALPPDTEDLVNYTLGLRGVEVGLLFMEQPAGGIKVSFRSRCSLDVSRLAETYGGGGHAAAAGATLQGELAEVQKRVLRRVEEEMAR
jgi:phosphoesterase RecJ-like protein